MRERIKIVFMIFAVAGKKRAGSRDHLRCVINVTHEKTYMRLSNCSKRM